MDEQVNRVDAPDEDECFPPEYRRQRHAAAKPSTASFDLDGTRHETREYLTDPRQRNDAVAALTELLPDGWRLRWTFAEQEGVLVVRSLTVEPEDRTTPPGGLRADTLRKGVSPAGAAVTANREYADAVAADDAVISPEAVRLVFARALAAARGPRATPRTKAVGRPRLSDDFIAAVACAYLEEQDAGRGVNGRVGARVAPLRGLRPRQVTPQATKDWVHTARTRGFLTPASQQGRRGAQPGPRLIEYLAQTGPMSERQ